jgi:hypothetical protein
MTKSIIIIKTCVERSGRQNAIVEVMKEAHFDTKKVAFNKVKGKERHFRDGFPLNLVKEHFRDFSPVPLALNLVCSWLTVMNSEKCFLCQVTKAMKWLFVSR